MSCPAEPTDTTGEGQNRDFFRAKQDALKFLAYRARSQTEVRRKLEKRYSGPVVERVVAELLGQHFLDDAAFALEWRRQRERRRPRSEKVLRQELLRLGVDAQVVGEALDDFDAADNAYRAALPLARRMEGTEFVKFRQRVWPHLQRRGFNSEVIASAVQRLWEELTDR